jgi:hypothetical protein
MPDGVPTVVRRYGTAFMVLSAVSLGVMVLTAIEGIIDVGWFIYPESILGPLLGAAGALGAFFVWRGVREGKRWAVAVAYWSLLAGIAGIIVVVGMYFALGKDAANHVVPDFEDRVLAPMVVLGGLIEVICLPFLVSAHRHWKCFRT